LSKPLQVSLLSARNPDLAPLAELKLDLAQHVGAKNFRQVLNFKTVPHLQAEVYVTVSDEVTALQPAHAVLMLNSHESFIENKFESLHQSLQQDIEGAYEANPMVETELTQLDIEECPNCVQT